MLSKLNNGGICYPHYEYFPNSSRKLMLEQSLKAVAFSERDGYLGGVIGTPTFELFILKCKVDDWFDDLKS